MKTKSCLLFSVLLAGAFQPPVMADTPYAVSSITADEIQQLPANGRDFATFARTLPSFQPGQADSTTNVTLRGIGGRSAVSPLYIVDGVPATGGADIDLDPSFIENVQVLKGTAATALYGHRGQGGAVIITTRAQAGYTEDVKRLGQANPDSASYLSGGLGANAVFGNPRTSFQVGADINYTAYEDNFSRNGDQEYDLNFSYLLSHEFSDNFAFQSYASLHNGAHQSIWRGYQRTGLGFSNATDWYSRTTGFYNLSGEGLGEGGIGGATSFVFSGFNESGFDAKDVIQYSLEQEFSQTFGNGTRAGVVGEYGMREWDKWYDLDADVIKVGGFVQQDLGSGFSATVSAGWEQRDYDRLNIERDEFYLNGTLGGPIIKDRLRFFLAGDYGVQENYLNGNGSVDFVDPIGLRVASGLRASNVGPGTLGLDLRFQHLETDLFPGPSWEITNTAVELSYAVKWYDFDVVSSVTYLDDDFDNGNNSNGFAYSLSAKREF